MTLAERTREGTGRLPPIARSLAAAPTGVEATAVTLDVDAPDPVALVGAGLRAGLEVACWLRPSDDLSIVGLGRAWAVETDGPGRFARAEAAWARASTGLRAADPAGIHGPRLLGGLGFLDRDPALDDPWGPFRALSLVLPELTLTIASGRASLTTCVPAGEERSRGQLLEDRWRALVTDVREGAGRSAPDAVVRTRVLGSRPDRAEWGRLVGILAGAVGRGRLDKVVLARRVEVAADRPFDVAGALRRLSDASPESATFAFGRGDRVFVGATPERLVRTEDRVFRTAAVAGSTRRGADAAEDAALAAALLASDKDREEHAVVVDALRSQLAPLTERLDVPGVPEVLPLHDLQHLVTAIRGTLRDHAGPLSLGALLHPTPAVAGAPRDLALALIAELEGFDRGWYAGPVGWLGPDGDGELMVALRSGVVAGDRATLFAGCGIVADSDAESEWVESGLKLRPMLRALGAEAA